ncbi:class I SAM-dependent methyltransferase [Criblamydia sequanensis]|uniref:Conserved putative membrane protein n=1 Tax=Candidatus Criblamydia sequanensis CRIB-18 TaxID=1437425 RepID=A0A090D271_9BACT|nr:class I SAM-dependent methyltransferase [Criblamydia sequanensis]CDR34380.1 Conserved putative membrane protein [Criblamydia sequanensis CRIB-18]
MKAFIIILFFISFFFILWVWVSVVFWSLRNGISPMPTSDKAKNKALALMSNETQGIVYDLGSGWGGMAIQIAKKLPHCQIIGFETSPVPFYTSLLWNKMERLANLKFVKKDFFHVNLSDASIVYCYLYPRAMQDLKAKFEEELKPGTIVISNTFSVPGWDPVQCLQLNDMYHTRIYAYVKSNSNVDALHAKPKPI